MAIGFVVNAKVKRYGKAIREDVLFSKPWLDLLEKEIKRVVVACAKKCKGDRTIALIHQDIVPQRITPSDEPLVCVETIKSAIKKVSPSLMLEKNVIRQLNGYVAQITRLSIQALDPKKKILYDLTCKDGIAVKSTGGALDADVAVQAPAKTATPAESDVQLDELDNEHHTEEDKTTNEERIKKTLAKVGPVTPRAYVDVHYEMNIACGAEYDESDLMATVPCFARLYTAFDDARIEAGLRSKVRNHFQSLGVAVAVDINITNIKRGKA